MKWFGLLTQRDPRLIAHCITPREKETDLQTDKEREKPGRKKRMRKWETAGRERDWGVVAGMEEWTRRGEREKETKGEREREREERMRAGSGETKRKWWDREKEGEEGRVRGRGEAASGPAYANPPWAASKSGRQAATAEEWAAFSHREKRWEGGNWGASEGMKKEGSLEESEGKNWNDV